MKGHIAEQDIALLAGADKVKKQIELERHLSECPVCSGLLEKYRKDRQVLRSLVVGDIPEEEYEAVRKSVQVELEATPGRTSAFPRGAWLRWAAALAATAVITAALGLWWMRHPSVTRVPVMPAPKRLTALPPRVGPMLSPPGPIQQEARRPSKTSTHAKPSATRIEQAQERPYRTAGKPSPLAVNIDRGRPGALERPPVLDDVAIKMETADPNVIIIWLAGPKGE